MSEHIRKDIARLVWIGGGGTPDGWDQNHGRPQPSHGPERPNYIDEKVAEAWATADLILAYLSGVPTTPVAPNLAQGGETL